LLKRFFTAFRKNCIAEKKRKSKEKKTILNLHECVKSYARRKCKKIKIMDSDFTFICSKPQQMADN